MPEYSTPVVQVRSQLQVTIMDCQTYNYWGVWAPMAATLGCEFPNNDLSTLPQAMTVMTDQLQQLIMPHCDELLFDKHLTT